tara:strand:+ start:461 stop:1162 length:702 start_codon:yes stop_codon:yes gene_type:complete
MSKEEIYPLNHGKPWSTELKKNLMDLYHKGHDLDSLARKFKRTSLSVELTIRKIKISNFLKERKIEKLIHFTDLRNLESIKKYGLLPVERLKKKKIKYFFNDKNRLDNQLGGISLSVTKRNDHLLKAFDNREKRDWVEIELDPEVASTRNCFFYFTNAANAVFKNTSNEKLSSFEYLELMFNEYITPHPNSPRSKTYTRTYKKINETTDEQAEIIANWIVPKTKILKINKINV